ncbi:hypothetical protein XFF6992_490040 [Xanthomonas citri pv. fuscans]|nr:hypothetical protein XFF6992_490040 [Xanthomonas citri pv. fuscans]SOO35005.1 hypothetical protein XFF6994_4990004 [Xanthomonas citri pv. fuscans]
MGRAAIGLGGINAWRSPQLSLNQKKL